MSGGLFFYLQTAGVKQQSIYNM